MNASEAREITAREFVDFLYSNCSDDGPFTHKTLSAMIYIAQYRLLSSVEKEAGSGEKCDVCIIAKEDGWEHMHADDIAKVEAGYALPPLNVTEKDRDLAKKQWPGVWPSKQEERAKVLARERQLKASLLREKGKDEEIERLRGLLREYYLSNCGDYEAKQCKHPFDCICVGERVKAAVTGDRP